MSEKPYVLRVAELIYFKIIEIKKQNPEINKNNETQIKKTKTNIKLLIPFLSSTFERFFKGLVYGLIVDVNS